MAGCTHQPPKCVTKVFILLSTVMDVLDWLKRVLGCFGCLQNNLPSVLDFAVSLGKRVLQDDLPRDSRYGILDNHRNEEMLVIESKILPGGGGG